MNLHDVLKYGHLTVMSTVDGLTDEEWQATGVSGWWSVKDIVAHLASFEEALAELGQHLVYGTPTPLLTRWFADEEQFNIDEVERRQHQTPQAVLMEYQDAHLRAAEALIAVSEEQRRTKGVVPYYGAEYDLEDFVIYSYYGHKREHAAQIAAYRDALVSKLAL